MSTVGSDDEASDEQTRLLESAEEAAAEVESGDYAYDYAPMKEVYKILIGICSVVVIIILSIAVYPSRTPQGGSTSGGNDVSNLESVSEGQTKVITKKPHIVFVTASGLGWNDVGWRNWEVRSPNLNRLAKKGVVFNWSYVEDADEPTQEAILSGLYPHFSAANCLPRNATFLPNVLRGAGYKTHMIGAWNIEHKNVSFLPNDIGFDSYFGSIGKVDYYNHRNSYSNHWENAKQVDGYNGTFLTDVFADRAVQKIRDHVVGKDNSPLFLYLAFQAIAEPTSPPVMYRMPENHPNVWKKRRRVYEMIYALDSAVGRVLDEIRSSGIDEDTIFIFSTTSGAAVDEAGSNSPLRGGKFTQWEGGTRATTIMRSEKLRNSTLYSGLFHAVDWLATLSSAAGMTPNLNVTDGVDYWSLLVNDFANRSVITKGQNVKVIRRGRYKLIIGNPVRADYKGRVLSKLNITDMNLNCVFNARKYFASDKCKDFNFDLSNATLLFDLYDDPGELQDISMSHPRILQDLKLELSKVFEDCVLSDGRSLPVAATPGA
ncbi:arylsulfatase B-like [Lineus longissimus]|uniref:arylsulfatase B-like n=1 Tax=Lineus longissimus TaxID=88925 RepID=UPI002B4D85C4